MRFIESENPTFRVVDMIKHLLPKALVYKYPILREDKDETVEEQGSRESEDEGMRSAAGEKPEISIGSIVGKGGKSDGSEVDVNEAENVIPVAVETMVSLMAKNEDMTEDSASVTSMATHQLSPAWIEKEALDLLGTIQQKGSIEKTAGRSKVLLAGYGFGGIVVKQVAVTCPSTVINHASYLFQGYHHRQYDSQILRSRPKHL